MDKVMICNQALNKIGMDRIDSLDEATSAARKCKQVYDIVLARLLREYDWGFTTKIASFALIAENVNGWSYAYQYPSDCIRFRKINDSTEDFRIGILDNTKVIYTDVSDLVGEYTYFNKNADQYDSLFTNVLIYAIAAEIAMALTGNPSLVQFCTAGYQSASLEAWQEDSRESKVTDDYTDEYIESRW